MWLILLILWVVLLVLVFYYFYKQRILRMGILRKNGIPGPKPHLYWGNLKEYLQTPNVIWDTELTKEYGPVCGYYMGAKPVVLITDPFIAEEILAKQGDSFLARPRRVPGGINPDPKRARMLGNLDVPEWKSLRHVLDKGFSPSKLKSMSTDMDKLTTIFMQLVDSAAVTEDNRIDFYPLYKNLTLDLIGKTGFGIHSDIQRNPNDALRSAVEQEFSKSTSSFILKLYLCLPEIQCLLQPIRVFWEKIKTLLGLAGHSELWDLGSETVGRKRGSPVTDTAESWNLLSTMIDSGALSNVDIVANSVLFFEAGFETMSAGLAFITYLLIKHPEIQEKVRNEIMEISKESNGTLSFMDKLKDFKQLDAVIKESLRLYPPQTTFIGRAGSKDLKVNAVWQGKEMTYTIPKGVHVQVGLYQILNSEKIWDSPRSFLPGRFLDETGEGSLTLEQKAAYIPFGKGRRICIGHKYANTALKLTLIKLLSKYRLCKASSGTNPNVDSKEIEIELDLPVVYKTATMTPNPKYGVCGRPELDPLFDVEP